VYSYVYVCYIYIYIYTMLYLKSSGEKLERGLSGGLERGA
jgi:hypothetical protein